MRRWRGEERRREEVRERNENENDLIAKAELHDVGQGNQGHQGHQGQQGHRGFEEVWQHSSNCHNLSVTCRMCVNVNPPLRISIYLHTLLRPALLLAFPFSPSIQHPAHPLGWDLWQCCRSVVINIYYVTCMQSTILS